MGRLYKNWLSCFRIDPPSLCPAAGENQRIYFFVFDHAELQIAIEWCGRNRLPIEHGVPLCKESPACPSSTRERRCIVGFETNGITEVGNCLSKTTCFHAGIAAISISERLNIRTKTRARDDFGTCG